MNENIYDAIIIGSGAGGAAAAYNLVQAGKQVLVLEKGGVLPRDGSTLDVKTVFKEGRYKNQTAWVDNRNHTFVPSEFYNVGGKTKWYGAALLRFAPHEFDADPEFLAALPADIRAEVLAQQQAQRLHQSQELEGQPVEMDTVSIIATFPSDLREEVIYH